MWARVTASLIVDDEGVPRLIMATVEDLAAERAAAASLDLIQSLLRGAATSRWWAVDDRACGRS